MFPTESKWFAVYTKSRSEKRVQLELNERGIENYLPLQRRLRKWSDRTKWVETPVISGYIFVRITNKQHFDVLKAEGVVSYVRFDGAPAVIRDEQIDLIKRLLYQREVNVTVSNQIYKNGDPIEIIAGPLLGIQGKLVRHKNTSRVVVQLENTELSFVLEIALEDIVPVIKEELAYAV
jgi:transcription antitermination factor NusG